MICRWVTGMALAALAVAHARQAQAEPLSFAVVNLSGSDLPQSVVEEAEREYTRLRPGTVLITDISLKRLLATGESPGSAVPRLVEEARAKRNLGACNEAIVLATAAEDLTLTSVPPDEGRDALKAIYTLLVACEDNLGRVDERTQAARRLRALVTLPPDDLPPGLWEAYVEKAVPGPGTVELQVDSEPPNAQIILNFHGVGVTPTTVKLPPGEVLIELQKEGYKKAFRRLTLQSRAERTVFRLMDVKRDRSELVASAMTTLAGKEDLREYPRSLAQLSQWARADALVILRTAGDRVSIEFFDAERGQMAQEHLFSVYDRSTGRIEVLAQKTTPVNSATSSSGGRPGILAPVASDGRTKSNVAITEPESAASTQRLQETYRAPLNDDQSRPNRGKAPWWGWLIAAAVAGGIAAAVLADQPKTSNTINVNATF